MKKITRIIAALLVPAMLASLTACGGGETSGTGTTSSKVESNVSASAPADITAKIMGDIKFPSMAEIKSDRLSTYYDVDADKIEAFSAYICGSGAYPDEIAVFKMKSADDVSAVKSVLDKRVESQTTTFKDYTPDEMYKIDGKNIIISGSYIALIICSDNAGATASFNSMTK